MSGAPMPPVRALAVLAALLVNAAGAGAADLRVVRAGTVAPGLTFTEWHGGAPDPPGLFDLRVGAEKEQRDADALLGRTERAGFAAIAVYDSERYEIRVPRFASRAEADAARERLAAAGLPDATVEPHVQDVSAANGPVVAFVLEVEPRSIDLVAAHSRDAAFGVETTRELAARRGALAAINGGFYRTKGELAGESEGVLVVGGRLLSEPDRGRAGVAFVHDPDGPGVQAIFDRLGFCGELRLLEPGRAAKPPIGIDGIDRARRAGEVVLYTPEFGRTPPAAEGGVDAVVELGAVRELVRGAGGTAIPPGGFVLAFDGAVRGAERLHPGTRVEIDTRLRALAPDPGRLWERPSGAVGAGPLLLSRGERVLAPEREAISRVFTAARHPRTAAAARADGTLLLVAVDGRRPDWSIGMSLPELTDFLLELGAHDAVNLDGGGSTTMVVRSETVNRPSDLSGERSNGDAILLFQTAPAAR